MRTSLRLQIGTEDQGPVQPVLSTLGRPQTTTSLTTGGMTHREARLLVQARNGTTCDMEFSRMTEVGPAQLVVQVIQTLLLAGSWSVTDLVLVPVVAEMESVVSQEVTVAVIIVQTTGLAITMRSEPQEVCQGWKSGGPTTANRLTKTPPYWHDLHKGKSTRM